MSAIKNKTLKKFGFVVVMGLALGLGGCAQETAEEPSAEPQASEQPNVVEEVDNTAEIADEAVEREEPAASTISVTAEELYSAFDANEAAAQIKYGKSTLIVSGVIGSVALDFLDKPVINLATSNMFSSVALGDVDNNVAASLSKGQSIQAKCNGLSEVVGSPQLSDCIIM